MPDKLLDRGLPPEQDLRRGEPAGLGEVQGQRPSWPGAGAPHQACRFEAVRQAYRPRMGQPQGPAQDADRLAGVVGQRHQRRGLGSGQPVRLVLGRLADPVRNGQSQRAEDVGRTRI